MGKFVPYFIDELVYAMKVKKHFNALYYQVKPLIPRRMQVWVRSKVVKKQRKRYAAKWPILEAAGQAPSNWQGWPQKKTMAVVLTHDVESRHGVAKCLQVAQMERELGFRSSFNFVARRYKLPDSLLAELTDMGFEVGVHGVYHDGKLFKTWEIFKHRSQIINRYLEKWEAVGFRAPAMHHNLDWLHELNISYDLSTFDTDPFEPQADGVGTIFPFWVSRNGRGDRYLEMPYTLVQDFTLFVLMKETSADIWRTKLAWIAQHGGMALLNTHPDYMLINEVSRAFEKYPVEYYIQFLEDIKKRYHGQYWNALPKEVARFYEECGALAEPGVMNN